jgi:hypothetical protein
MFYGKLLHMENNERTDGNHSPDLQSPPITEPWKWLGFHLTKDWRMIFKYPIALLAIFIFTIAAAWLLTWQVVVPEKTSNYKQSRKLLMLNSPKLIFSIQNYCEGICYE